MKSTLGMLAFAGWVISTQGQPTNSFPLWPEGAPGALGTQEKDIPTLTPYFPDPAKATGAAMVICPGGGYWDLYWQLEGEEVAQWLNSLGVTGIILKYRVPRRPDEPKGMPARRPLQDAQRAVVIGVLAERGDQHAAIARRADIQIRGIAHGLEVE